MSIFSIIFGVVFFTVLDRGINRATEKIERNEVKRELRKRDPGMYERIYGPQPSLEERRRKVLQQLDRDVRVCKIGIPVYILIGLFGIGIAIYFYTLLGSMNMLLIFTGLACFGGAAFSYKMMKVRQNEIRQAFTNFDMIEHKMDVLGRIGD
jgi:uncharacterized membrane protein